MATCTGCGTTTTGGLRPNLSCPPDLSQLLFRFIERKRLGVVKGTDDLSSLDMTQFFIPLNGYVMTQWNLCSDDSMRIDAGSAMDFGKRREIQEFDIANLTTVSLGVGVTATLNVTEGTTDHGTLVSIAADTYSIFITNLKAAIAADTTITAEIEFNTDDLSSIFTLRGKTYGDAFTYILTFDDGAPEVLASTVTQTALRYPNGAWKVLFLNIVFCSDCTASNQLFIEYAYDSDVVTNGESGATWRPLGPILILSGAEDVTETDTNKIETIWVRNTQTCDVEIQGILAT